MNAMTLANAVQIHTGTGLIFNPYSQGPDQGIWQNVATPATRTIMTLNRTRPKPTPTFAGVDRLEFKNAQFFTVGTTEYQSVISIITSVPVVADLTHRQLLRDRIKFMSQRVEFVDALETGSFIS